MTGRSVRRRWQVILVLGLIASIVSLFGVVGSATFASVSGLVTVGITLCNALLSPKTTRRADNWVVDLVKRTLIIGPYAKVICVVFWSIALVNCLIIAKSFYAAAFKGTIKGVVIDDLTGAPVEKATVYLRVADQVIKSTFTEKGAFTFDDVDRRKCVNGKTYVEASFGSNESKKPIDVRVASSVDVTLRIGI